MFNASRQQASPEHREAVRMAWKALHIPFGTILVGALLLAGVLSAFANLVALGPSNAMP